MAQEKEKKEFIENTMKTIGGGIAGNVAMDLIEDHLIPMLPDNIKSKIPKQVAPAISLASSLWFEYYSIGNKKLEPYQRVAQGVTAVTGAELFSMFMPNLSGSIGAILDPLMRTNRVIPGTTEISK